MPRLYTIEDCDEDGAGAELDREGAARSLRRHIPGTSRPLLAAEDEDGDGGDAIVEAAGSPYGGGERDVRGDAEGEEEEDDDVFSPGIYIYVEYDLI